MAGMLPGVESARRRRCHGSGGLSDLPGSHSGHGSTRRSSFCLYTIGHDSHLTSSSSLLRNMIEARQDQDEEKLGGAAKEAKERLDERLRAQWKSQTKIKRANSKENLIRSLEQRSRVMGVHLHAEVFGLKKSGSKKFSWAKMGWKASDQNECTVCLDHFKVGETLVHLPCAHRFHSRCLVPWLEINSHCPCCRMGFIN